MILCGRNHRGRHRTFPKVEIQHEAILPADLGFPWLEHRNMLTFIPGRRAHVTILRHWRWPAALLALILVLRHFDGRKGRMIRTF